MGTPFFFVKKGCFRQTAGAAVQHAGGQGNIIRISQSRVQGQFGNRALERENQVSQ
jgi:hypothetical protein